MTFQAAYEGVREAITTIVGDTWGVTVVTAQSAQERTDEFAYITLDGAAELANSVNSVNEEWAFPFLIIGRLALADGEDAELVGITKAGEMHAALLAVPNPGEGFSPLVRSVTVQPADTADGYVDVALSYTVQAIVDR